MASIDRYAETIGGRPLNAFLEQPDIKQAVEAFFATTIGCVSSTDRPRGCLIMNVASVRAADDAEVRDKLSCAHNERVAVIAERIVAAQNEGQLPLDPDADSLARMIVSVMHSLAALARIGASRRELSHLAQSFLGVLFPAADQ